MHHVGAISTAMPLLLPRCRRLLIPYQCHARTQTKRAATYDPQDPRLLTCLEEAREAHWRLAGTKGFKALQVG
jgi:hypothetical protein